MSQKVMSWLFSFNSSWWYPWFISRCENTVAPLSSFMISSSLQCRHFLLSFFCPRTYPKGYYFYSPHSSSVIKSKMAATQNTPALQASKKLENVRKENSKKIIHCPHKSLISHEFQGPTHIFQIFQAWILKFNFDFPDFPGPTNPELKCSCLKLKCKIWLPA